MRYGVLLVGLVTFACNGDRAESATPAEGAREPSSEADTDDRSSTDALTSTTQAGAASPPNSTPDGSESSTSGDFAVPLLTALPLLESAGCVWWKAFPPDYTKEDPSVVAAYSLRCEDPLDELSLAADGDTVRILFSHQGSFHLHQIQGEEFEDMLSFTQETDPELRELGTPHAELVSSSEIVVWNAGGQIWLKRIGDGELLDVDLGLPDYAPYSGAGFTAEGELVLALVTDEETTVRPLQRLSNFEGGYAVQVNAGMTLTMVTPQGTVLGASQSGDQQDWVELSETEVLPRTALPQGVLAASAAPSGMLALASVFQNTLPGAPTPTSQFRELTAWSEKGALVLESLEPMRSGECSGTTTDVQCPSDSTSTLLGQGLHAPAATTNLDGDWVSTIKESHTEQCQWQPVTCDSAGFCSHERGCERFANTRTTSELLIFDALDAVSPVAALPLSSGATLIETAAAEHWLHVASVAEREVVLLTLNTAEL